MTHQFLPFALPDLDETELQFIKEVLDSGWIITGPKTRKLEQEIAAHVGAVHAVAVNSCTAAMHLALEAIGLEAGDAVITTPYTFAATAEVLRYFGATPIFVDVDRATFNMDPTKLAETVAAFTDPSSARQRLPRFLSNNGRRPVLKAIMPVHMAGYPCELDAIYGLANLHDLAVIEDAAHAFGSKYGDAPIGESRPGASPSAVCFSFYATKCLTTAEGGLICTADEALAERCRMMSLHGISKDVWRRYTAEGSWYYEILAPGFKYNLTDVAAALGLAQLRKEERMRLRRRAIAQHYNEAFGTTASLQVPYDSPACQHAWHLYMLRLHLDQLKIDRARFMEELKARQIGASVHFIPLHVHPYYRDKYGYEPDDYPVALQEYQREVSLPIYSKMTDADVSRVVEAVKDILLKHRR